MHAGPRKSVALSDMQRELVPMTIDTPLTEAERRDVKGLYKKARAGQLARKADSLNAKPPGAE